MGADPTRRTLLAASAAGLPLLLTACRGVQVLGSPPPPPAEIRTLRAAIAAEAHLADKYVVAVATAHAADDQAAVATLTAVRAEHSQHLAQLKSRLVQAAAQRSESASKTGLGFGSSDLAPVLAGLEQAELAASDRLLGQLAGLPPSLAELFASIAACEATHVPLLRSLGRHS